MDINWIKVYSSDQHVAVDVAKGLLYEHGISSNIMNKQDSVIVALGEVELYVPEANAAEALRILQEAGVLAS